MSPAATTLRKLTMSAVASPCRVAAARISSGNGLIDSTRRSAANASPACWETAERTRSVKNVTALIAATATTSAASSTSTSPDRQSLASRRAASRHGVLITAVAPFVAPLGIAWRVHDTGAKRERQTRAADRVGTIAPHESQHAPAHRQRRRLAATHTSQPEGRPSAQLSLSRFVRRDARRHRGTRGQAHLLQRQRDLLAGRRRRRVVRSRVGPRADQRQRVRRTRGVSQHHGARRHVRRDRRHGRVAADGERHRRSTLPR